MINDELRLVKKSIKRSRSNVQIWWWLSKYIFHKPQTTNIYKLLLDLRSGTLTLWRNIELFTNPCFGAINLDDLFFSLKKQTQSSMKRGQKWIQRRSCWNLHVCSSESLYIYRQRALHVNFHHQLTFRNIWELHDASKNKLCHYYPAKNCLFC